MNDPSPTTADSAPPRDLDFAQAGLAYRIISALLEHTRITGDLIALMAQTLDEDTTKALTNTPYWSAYLDSRRQLERTRRDIEEFTAIMTRLKGKDEAKTTGRAGDGETGR